MNSAPFYHHGKTPQRSSIGWVAVVTLMVSAVLAVAACAHNGEERMEHSAASLGASPVASTGKYRDLAISDMDGDGHLDIVAASSFPGQVVIFFGDGSGGLTTPVVLSVRGDVLSVTVADFDHDGLQDIAAGVARESKGILVWSALSDRQWVEIGTPTKTGLYNQLASADINGDGHMDLIAANAISASEGGVQVWLGDGNGGWLLETGPTVAEKVMGIAVGDFNEDNFIDIVGASWGQSGTVKIWTGNGSGGWSTGGVIATGSFYNLSTADVDGDGHLDLLVGTYREGIRLFSGDGNGLFNLRDVLVEDGSYWKALAIPGENGSVQAIVTGSVESKGFLGWKRSGENSWLPIEGVFPNHGTYYGIGHGDLNGDGFEDICAASFSEGVKIWLGGPIGNRVDLIGPTAQSDDETAADLINVEENKVFKMVDGIPEYKVGAGDVLEITMWQEAEPRKSEIIVRADGKISYGFIQDLVVSGMTVPELDRLLNELLSQRIRDPQIDIRVDKPQSKFVTFSGEIQRNPSYLSGPGKYPIPGKVNLFDMLGRVGGPTNQANLTDVLLRRKNGDSFKLNFAKLINQGDQTQDVVLDDGDFVFLPPISKTKSEQNVYVFGEVKNPGAYTFADKEIKLFDVISEAGGIGIYAKAEFTRVVRGDIDKPEIITSNLNSLIAEGDWTQNIPVYSGDLVFVPRSGLGDAALFAKQLLPILRLIVEPAYIFNQYDEAARRIESGGE